MTTIIPLLSIEPIDLLFLELYNVDQRNIDRF